MFNRTLAASEKILSSIAFLNRVINIAMQCILLLFSFYQCYTSFGNWWMFGPYVFGAVVSLGYLIVTIAKPKGGINRVYKLTTRWLKIGSRLVVAGVSTYNIVVAETTAVDKLLFAIMAISLLFTILFEIIGYSVDYAVKMMKAAVSADVEELKVGKLAHVIDFLGAPISSAAEESEEPASTGDKWLDRVNAMAAEREARLGAGKEERKAAAKARAKALRAKALGRIGKGFQALLKGDKKGEKPDAPSIYDGDADGEASEDGDGK